MIHSHDPINDESNASGHSSSSNSKSGTDEQLSLFSKNSMESFDETKDKNDLKHHLNQTSNEHKEGLSTFQSPPSFVEGFRDDREDYLLPTSFGKRKMTCSHRKTKGNYHSSVDDLRQTKPFSLIFPRNPKSNCKRSNIKHIEAENDFECSWKVLRSGMVLLKNYLSLDDQVEIVNICHKLGIGPGGFYQPGYQDGAKLRLHMMCLGRNWDPQTKYEKHYRSDGSEAPPVPDKLVSLVEKALRDSRALLNSADELPLMSPDICIVNFYTTAGRLGLHQDRDESGDSLNRGLPVVSFSIGDSAEFLYGDKREVGTADEFWLESGDVLIFGGKSRHIFHGVNAIVPYSAPLPLLQATKLRPGRLNLTFRQF